MHDTALLQAIEDPLRCRVVAAEGSAVSFAVEIRGAIAGVGRSEETLVSLSLEDVTEGQGRRLRVLHPPRHASTAEEVPFSSQSPLGRVEAAGTVVSEWTAVAHLKPDGLWMPRRGPRHLQVGLSVQTATGRRELARAYCLWGLEWPQEGYLDAQEKASQARLWALPLAFAVAGRCRRPSWSQCTAVRRWILPGIPWRSLTWWTRARFHWALLSLAWRARQTDQDQLDRLCNSIKRVAPMAPRYAILDLCLKLAASNERVYPEELEQMWRFGEWLELDPQRLRSMMEKALPIHRHEIGDPNYLLGLSSTLTSAEARQQLNREYAKWNARVTHANQSVQQQAARMLELIAEARGQYV